MKTKDVLITFLFLIIGSQTAEAQFLKKLGKRAEKAAENTVLKKSEQKVTKETEKAMDTILNGNKKKSKRPKKSTSDSENQNRKSVSEKEMTTERSVKKNPSVWSQYNFVPGDKIIFMDDLVGEENGEFPSRWDLLSGNAENASYGDHKVINLLHKAKITPLMDKEHYLPEVFTIEFDALFQRKNGPTYQDYLIRLWADGGKYGYSDDRKNYCSAIRVSMHGASLNCTKNGSANEFEGFDEAMVVAVDEPVWRHVAISFNKRSLKLFVDENRFLNIPNVVFEPEALVLEVFAIYKEPSAIKNVRIAEGGKKLYDRVVTDGRFVTRGILFDINSATIKPESGGVLKEVATMMKEHPNLNFRIEGHTDSDGDDQYNLKLSAQRAEAVKWALVDMGITENRFETEGKGEAVPVWDNTNPEGKANNRRVEFVRL